MLALLNLRNVPRTHVVNSGMVFAPENMGMDTLFVQLFAISAEI